MTALSRFALTVLLVCCGHAFAIEIEGVINPSEHRVEWCGDLLRRPLSGPELEYALDAQKEVRAIDKEIGQLDYILSRPGGISERFENERHQLWLEKIAVREELLRRLESTAGLYGQQYMIVKEILDAHVNAIHNMREYLAQLKRTGRATNIALASQVLDVFGSMVFHGFSGLFKYITLAAIAYHTHAVGKVAQVRGAVETEFVRLQELLLIHDEKMRKRYPMLSSPMPYSVLGLGLLDTFHVTDLISMYTQPVPLGSLVTAVNAGRLIQNGRIIRQNTKEVVQITNWLNAMSMILERDLFAALLRQNQYEVTK